MLYVCNALFILDHALGTRAAQMTLRWDGRGCRAGEQKHANFPNSTKNTQPQQKVYATEYNSTERYNISLASSSSNTPAAALRSLRVATATGLVSVCVVHCSARGAIMTTRSRVLHKSSTHRRTTLCDKIIYFGLPFRLAIHPGFRATYVPKGNHDSCGIPDSR